MTPRARSAATLAALTALVVGGGVVGLVALTSPLPEQAETPTCIATTARPGDVIFPDQVTVSVYNGSPQNGLASRTMGDLVDRGFHRGENGNSPRKLRKGVEIWASDAENPAVALVAAQFKKPKIVPGETLGPGVVVVVGDESSLRKITRSPDKITATAGGTLCTPPGHDTLLDG